jgi:hypothetical protein
MAKIKEPTITLDTEQIVEAMRLCLSAGLVPHLQSSPGMGKSSVVDRFCEAIQAQEYGFRIADKNPEDLSVPYIDIANGVSRSYPNSGLPRGDGRSVLFIDELKQAAQQATLNVMTQLILDRRLGQDYVLPAECGIITASNLDTDGAGTLRMPTHLRNRLIHLYPRSSFERWAVWASGSTLDKPAILHCRLGARMPMAMPPLLVGFLQTRPGLLNCTGGEDDGWKSCYAFNTERSWEFVGRLLAEAEHLLAPDEILKACVAGAVGVGPMLELWGFRDIVKHMPDVKAILSGQPYAPITDPQIKWVMTCAIGPLITKGNCSNAIACLKQMGGEYCALALKLLKGRLGGKASSLTDLGKPYQEFVAWMAAEHLI